MAIKILHFYNIVTGSSSSTKKNSLVSICVKHIRMFFYQVLCFFFFVFLLKWWGLCATNVANCVWHTWTVWVRWYRLNISNNIDKRCCDVCAPDKSRSKYKFLPLQFVLVLAVLYHSSCVYMFYFVFGYITVHVVEAPAIKTK